MDISEISPQEPGSEIPVPILDESTEHIPSSKSRTQPPLSNLPTISVTKAPAPLPVILPTPLDITSSPSPPPFQNPSFEDLESGRVNGMREVAEDIGLVTSTRKTGKAKSPLRLDSSDAIGSAIPMLSPPPPLISPVALPATSAIFPSTFPVPPDLLADSIPGIGKELIEPSPLTPEVTHPPLEPDTFNDDLMAETTIRLVGGSGQAGGAEIPVASSPIEEQPPLEATKDPDVATINSFETGSKPNEKSHQKLKSNLASLKKIGQLGRTIKRDSVSSLKGILSPR